MSGLNFISLNARGLNSPQKRSIVLDFLRKRNTDFAMIQESHLLPVDISRFANKMYHSIASSSATTKSKGVMVICKRNLKFTLVETWSDKEGRITIAKICINGARIALISVYAPNICDPKFYQLLTQSLLEMVDYQIILGGDFNAVWDNNMDRSGGVETREQHLASKALRQWANDTGMVDIWRKMHPSLKDFSFFSGRHKTFSRIDFLFVSSRLFSKVNNTGYTPVTWSYHKIIHCSANLYYKPKKVLRWRFNVSLLQDEDYKKQFESQLKEFLEFNEGSVSDPRILWEAVKGFIRSNATLYASTRNKERSQKLTALEQQYANLDSLLQKKYCGKNACSKRAYQKRD